MPEPRRLDETAAQWRRGLLVLAGDPRNEVSGGLFADRPADLLEHWQRLAFGAQCIAPPTVKAPRSPHRFDRPGLVLLGDRRKARDFPILLGKHVSDQIVPRVKPEGRLSCSRCMIRMMAPFCLSFSRL